MIQYIKRKNLNVAKYDACIENAVQSRIYAFSWYLDIVADNWDVLVLDDYKAVMPIPWKKKYFIKYVYTPLRVLELGVFSLDKIEIDIFLIELYKRFSYVNLRMNTLNSFHTLSNDPNIKQQQYISLKDSYELILKQYRSDRKKDLKKAKKAGLTEKWEDSTDNLINLFRSNVGKRFKSITVKDYKIMKKVVEASIEKNGGEVLSIYDKDNKLVSSAFLIRNKGKITILFSSTDLKNRNNGANTYLIDRAIYKYQNNNTEFYFGGSSIESIANYFKSFGAETSYYNEIKHNSLPTLFRLFKK